MTLGNQNGGKAMTEVEEIGPSELEYVSMGPEDGGVMGTSHHHFIDPLM